MADAPPTLQTSEELDRALGPYRTLIAWHEAMKEQGGLERAANEAQSRAQSAQRDLQAAQAQLDQTRADHEGQLEEAKKGIHDAQVQAQAATDAANTQAAQIIADASAQAATMREQASADLAALGDKQRFAAKTLSDTNAQIEQAQGQLSAIQSEMTALKARLG